MTHEILTPAHRLRPGGRAVLSRLKLWHRRWHSRRALRRLPPERLKDIGLSEAQRRAELARPPWR
ncbi:DUF1127 domain-containing protein [Pseudooceanicola sp. CBS1P-1]|uniref:DUF1127 domain-containing protein n=1 Tax=Pseudooceanicola albus TaxID=2692189 RepID=A0A6L7G5U6_9RHOB|nr:MULTISPECIES: DUF1127 domain-containing protein [Pseudooceanicola]MBT9385375.1 DUF1127 domain-containing protein [Pseudooceanicola endophyticus]MXN18766.1 DUF1127 domain-containing protein [Pseudooceanicola albus]